MLSWWILTTDVPGDLFIKMKTTYTIINICWSAWNDCVGLSWSRTWRHSDHCVVSYTKHSSISCSMYCNCTYRLFKQHYRIRKKKKLVNIDLFLVGHHNWRIIKGSEVRPNLDNWDVKTYDTGWCSRKSYMIYQYLFSYQTSWCLQATKQIRIKVNHFPDLRA